MAHNIELTCEIVTSCEVLCKKRVEMIKEKIKADLYSYAKRIQELEREIKHLRKGLLIAQQDESARTGRQKTKFDKYLKAE